MLVDDQFVFTPPLLVPEMSAPGAPSTHGAPRRTPGVQFPAATEIRAPQLLSPVATVLNDGDSEYRLPTDVSPIHYNLTVLTDLEDLSFKGTVEIDLAIRNTTSRIVLNAADLELQNISISLDDGADGQTLVPISEAADKLMERVTLLFPAALPAGSTARLFVAFTGVLPGSMVGYYRSLTTGADEDAKARPPRGARRAFPCWDEPALKATFAIGLISRAGTVNLSNMPAYAEEPCDPGEELDRLFAFPEDATGDDDDDAGFAWKITRFETTPVMSTYLVAYANGGFAHLESSFCSPISGRTVPLRIYATPRNVQHAGFALELTARVLPLYEQIFDIEYPLPKLDTLVVMFAMENWGLIIGRASGYLLTDASMLRLRKEIVALHVHEVAHMLFGNITTMSWWRYLYLNEGELHACPTRMSGTNMGEVIIPVYPEWQLHAEFVNEHINKAFSLDSGLSSHPVEVICSDPNKINQIFDGLSYSKAASVLRMLSQFVGEDKFLKGVSLYLKQRLYGSSTTTDLWTGVEEATGINVTAIMDDWISKPGFPVVTVREREGGLHLRQERFFFTDAARERSRNNSKETLWVIPLHILSVDDAGNASVDHEVVLRDREQFIPLDTNKPFKINAGTTGYYRVVYPQDRLKAICVEATKEASLFSVADHVGLVHDAVALAKADLVSMSNALTLVYAMRSGKDYHVWAAVTSNSTNLVSIWWEHERIVELLNAFRRALFSPLVAMLGYQSRPEESSNDSLLRTCAITQALDAGDKEYGRFTHSPDESNIPSDLVTATYTAAVRYGGRQEQAMCAAQAPELTNETFPFVLSGVRDQDIMYFIGGLAQSLKMRRRAAIFILDNFDEMHERFKDGFGLSKNSLQLAFSTLSTEDDRHHLVTFFEDKDTSKFSPPLSQVLDSIDANCPCIQRIFLSWLQRSTENILTWLEGWSQQ
ncbi:peptidase family M1-domain-containing protein [Mycena sp. CBHHK59/15]|nr:peptidase family M1-domain-containing protein [Mycena sp. CBHHK59/15]